MGFERLKRWQWCIISLILGLLVGYVRYLQQDDPIGESWNYPWQMELDLLAGPFQIGGVDLPRLKNIRITHQVDPANSAKMVYVIQATKYDPRAPGGTYLKKGKRYPTEFAYRFMVPDGPYHPKNAIADATPAAANWRSPLMKLCEKLKLKEADPPGTILDYFAQIKSSPKHTKDFSYSYQWWLQKRVTIAMYTAGSFVVIGGIWPFLVNLVAYGSLFAPKQEKGISLRKVKSSATTGPVRKPGMTDKDMAQLLAMEAELEAKLKEGAKPRQAGAAEGEQPATPLRQLTATAPTGAQVEEKKEDRTFGAKADDYYPVERRVTKKEDEK